jgi:hypothetical protein
VHGKKTQGLSNRCVVSRPDLCVQSVNMTTIFEGPAEETSVKLLPAPALVKALLPEDTCVSDFVFSMMALYGDGSAHAEATDFIRFLTHKLAPDIDVQTSEWSFEELDHLRPGTVSTELGEQTDFLLLVSEEQQDLPLGIRRWIASWLKQARPSCALVCLVGSAADRCPVWPAHHNLKNACAEAGVSFFASSFQSRGDARQCCPAHHFFTAGFSLSGVSHWGINE